MADNVARVQGCVSIDCSERLFPSRAEQGCPAKQKENDAEN
jgi:hypothetical protein